MNRGITYTCTITRNFLEQLNHTARLSTALRSSDTFVRLRFPSCARVIAIEIHVRDPPKSPARSPRPTLLHAILLSARSRITIDPDESIHEASTRGTRLIEFGPLTAIFHENEKRNGRGRTRRCVVRHVRVDGD